MLPRVLALALSALLLALAAAPAGALQPGRGCDFVGLRLEGECYRQPTPTGARACTLEERTQVVTAPWFSDGAAVFMGDSGCGVTFLANVPEIGTLDLVGLRAGGAGGVLVYQLFVTVDGVPHGYGEAHLTACNCVTPVWLTNFGPILPGPHVVTFHYAVLPLDGPQYLNLELDHIDLVPS